MVRSAAPPCVFLPPQPIPIIPQYRERRAKHVVYGEYRVGERGAKICIYIATTRFERMMASLRAVGHQAVTCPAHMSTKPNEA